MPTGETEIPDEVILEGVARLFRKIDSAQANIRFLVSDSENLRRSAQSALDRWKSFTKAVAHGSPTDGQMSLADDLWKSISALLRQLDRFGNQISRRREALEKLKSLTEQNLRQLSAFRNWCSLARGLRAALSRRGRQTGACPHGLKIDALTAPTHRFLSAS